MDGGSEEVVDGVSALGASLIHFGASQITCMHDFYARASMSHRCGRGLSLLLGMKSVYCHYIATSIRLPSMVKRRDRAMNATLQ